MVDQEPSGQKKPKPSDSFLRFSGLGIQLLAGIGLAAWGGYYLDKFFQFKFPIFLLTLVMLAFIGMMVVLYRSLNK